MRVICVDDSPRFGEMSSGLIKWKEYIVSPCPEETWGGHAPGFIVYGVQPPNAGKLLDDFTVCCRCFCQMRFRPIKEVDVNAMFRCEETANA